MHVCVLERIVLVHACAVFMCVAERSSEDETYRSGVGKESRYIPAHCLEENQRERCQLQ